MIKTLKKSFLKNPIRRSLIRSVQEQHLDEQNCGSYSRLVVFFVPGRDEVNGGVMSIVSMAKETRALFANSSTGVFVCGAPWDPPHAKFTKFQNNETIVEIFDLMRRCRSVKSVLFHVPEFFVGRIGEMLRNLLSDFPGSVSLNVLLQNIDMAPSPEVVNHLKGFGKLTITTAHKAYSGKKTADLYQCPVHHLSVWVSKEKYIYTEFHQKGDIITVSPDSHELRKSTLKNLKNKLKHFEIITIKNMRYEDYRDLISRTKFSLTFGEGLDGYFAEPIFSGGIGCAVYNNRFFSLDYQNLPFVYESWDELNLRISSDIERACGSANVYRDMHLRQLEVLEKNYDSKEYVSNLLQFYNKFFN